MSTFWDFYLVRSINVMDGKPKFAAPARVQVDCQNQTFVVQGGSRIWPKRDIFAHRMRNYGEIADRRTVAIRSEGKPFSCETAARYPRAALSGLPWSPRFMAAYELATQGERMEVGRAKNKPGTIAALVASHYPAGRFLAGVSGSRGCGYDC